VPSISSASVYVEHSLLLKILRASSELPCIPPAGSHLYCCLTTHLSVPPLYLRQGGCFDTTYEHMLQADILRVEDLNFMMWNVLNCDYWNVSYFYLPRFSSNPLTAPVHFPIFPSSLTCVQYKTQRSIALSTGWQRA